MKNPYLHRYWIEFELPEPQPQRSRGISTGFPYGIYYVLYRGCGVTAYTHDDALMILQKQLRLSERLPPVVSLQEDFDVSTLETKQILSHIGVTIFRGTWYPNIGPYGR